LLFGGCFWGVESKLIFQANPKRLELQCLHLIPVSVLS